MTATPPAAEEVDLTVARALWAAGDPVVDVRSPQEYAAGHVAGAVNVPLDRLAFVLGTLPPGQVLTVCSLGNRSRQGAERLARLGRPAVSLRGGTKAWVAAGLPTHTGADPGERGRARRLRPWRRAWWQRGRTTADGR
ncbi:rhodanese-like domain-containing protein [Actinopolymorpha singaporensis]|uniref:Rhodanese-related sulfurtransferase n=1 Tax=Actinopolymorpha singaporensis TaxID=117157 RepID=A0A1H1SG30_9ACTN|nr:rhodanese-like domain-containing protein [Actinopolymorpha singaporensis]SDS46927.1 Rhodanese-related sulfurtransferase [Actinopolymorpha singaporensis]